MVKDQIIKALAKATGKQEKEIVLDVPAQSNHGDYSTNIAMQMDGNPQHNAKEIVRKVVEDSSLKHLIADIKIAGPGFVNFWVDENKLVENLSEIIKNKDSYGSSEIGNSKTIVIDYSAPNIAKRFSVGHLRSTVIGQALYNIYQKLGYKVIGDNHLGDWGTQFGVLIYMVELNKLNPSELTIEDWEKLYVDFHNKLESSPELKNEARKAFKRLEEGEEKANLIWQAAHNTSMAEYKKIYNLLDVEIDHAYGESFYEDKMEAVIKEFRSKGLARKSEGAEIVEFENLTPAMLVKSDGTTTYFTRDLATIKFRIQNWGPSVIIYEVGADQTLHFRQVFAAAKLIGWAESIHFEHVAHGMIRLPEGKMSTRKGRTIKLEEVISKAIEKAKELGCESEELAQRVGIGALKYYDLSHSPQSEIVFDWNKMFVLQGNSGPYLQYTYARTQSVLERHSGDPITAFQDDLLSTPDLQLTIQEEGVMRHLLHFPEVVETVGKFYTPNILANYLYELASKFNTFYGADKIVGSDKELFRLALTAATGQILKNGLSLLGISAPERM